jgi:hypothetical protein
MRQNGSTQRAYTVPLFEKHLREEIPGQDLDRFTAAARACELIYHGDPLLYCLVPAVFNESARKLFRDIAGNVASICAKVTRRFIESPEYRALWNLDDLSTELALLDTGYSSLIPIMRADIFLNDATGDFKFCEINTDGTSAMNEDRCAANVVQATDIFKDVATGVVLQSQELFEPWVDKLSALYSEWSSKKGCAEPMRVAIVDFDDDATTQEFEEFQARFTRRGIDCRITDIASLRYENGKLSAGGKAINSVYRRATSGRLISDLQCQKIASLSQIDGSACDGSLALVSAAKYGAAAVVGGFRTLLAHNKQFFEMLWRPESFEFLDASEIEFIQNHVPKTMTFSPNNADLKAVISSKERWILKPKNGSSTVGVFAGRDHSEEEWADICKQRATGDYVLQEYCQQYSSPNLIPQTGMRKPEDFNYIGGLFIYCDALAGVYVRAGQGSIIGSIRGSAVVASFMEH